MFFKIGILKNFCNIHRKTPELESLFDKVAVLKISNFIKKRLQKLQNFNTFFTEHLRWLLLLL